ncbi:MAG: undecaprenyl-diphosphate phosphatase [Lentisphaeraceae bacterium]|nr:undecaprenyl-diphosphate phosphatase [Lentisphaeraceae bacterium]
MEEFFKNVIMGLVQGFSEFLPISSSGHLVLFGDWLQVRQVKDTHLLLSIVVHLGTLAAVLVYFKEDIKNMISRLPEVPAFVKNGMKVKNEQDEQTAMIWYIFVGSIPAAIIGFTFKDQLEELFTNKEAVLIALTINAFVLWSSRYTQEKSLKMNALFAVLIGCGQAIAIVPGISRSGMTIVFALWLGLTRSTSASFSFLLSIPVILGASLLELKDIGLGQISSAEMLNFSGACLAAGLSGYFAIKLINSIIQKQKFEYFAVYCLAVSATSLVML